MNLSPSLEFEVCGEAAGEAVSAGSVNAEVGRVDVDDHRADPVEEHAVVARDHDNPGQVEEELFEELHRRVVQVVCRLVQDHALGPSGDESGQREAAPFAAGHRRRPSCGLDLGEAESGRCELGPSAGVPGVVVLRPDQRFGVLLGGLRAVEPVRHVLESSYRVVQRSQRGGQGLRDRRRPEHRRVLRQVAEVWRPRDPAGVAGLLPCEQAQQGGLSGAVLAHDSDRLARVCH